MKYYIKGKNFRNVIRQIYKGENWHTLSVNKKKEMLHLLLQITGALKKIHNKGYVHRDFTPLNILLTTDKRIFIIDFELAYGTKIKYPIPVFEAGTEGYMSPEQERGNVPTPKEDIYALGALMIVLFTNLPPTKFDRQSKAQIKKSILFFTKRNQLANLISSCLSESPNERPELWEIEKILVSLKGKMETSDNITIAESSPSPTQPTISALICSALEGLTISTLVDNGKLIYGSGLVSPINGILYLIHKALPLNCPTIIIEFFRNYLQVHQDSFLSEHEDIPPGLFYGSAGRAIGLNYAILLGFLPGAQENIDRVEKCFNTISDKLDLAQGVSGQVLAALLIYSSSKSAFIKEKLMGSIKILIDSQHEDGSWPLYTDVNGERNTIYGVENGISGIIIALTKYDKIFPDEKTKIAIHKGLHWLMSCLNKKPIQFFKKLKNAEEDNSFITGLAGIALVFLISFEHLGNLSHKNAAEQILLKFPEFPVSIDYSLVTGLSGLGFVYSEAARICKNPVWEKRSIWIYNMLAHTVQNKEGDKISWNVGRSNEYQYLFEAGLFTGSSGIILFLLKFQENQVSHEL